MCSCGVGKKLDLNAAHRLERALVMVGSESYQAALKQFAKSPKELKKYKDILTNTVQNRNLLTGMDNYAKLPNGRGVERQQAMMDRLAADVGEKMGDTGNLRGQVLNEYRHVGVHERPGGVSTSGRLGAMLVVMQTWVISSNTSTMLMETSSRSTSSK